MPRIVVGLSGGVDSALAAALLQERGWDVVSCYLKVAIADAPCPWREDLPMAHRVAAHLNIPLTVKDVSVEYTRDVLEPMIAAYRAGETPNPDTMCNRWVKFAALAAVAREFGAVRIATGHYARLKHFPPPHGEGMGQVELLRGADSVKDQSYFLWQLTPQQLEMCEFPIGEWTKHDVRAEAKRRGLPNCDRESTSGVCFLGEVALAKFLASRAVATPATVVTTTGEVVGTVPAAEALTIGQRAPIAGQSMPRYVVATAPAAHRVIVSATPDDPARLIQAFVACAPNWIGTAPKLPLTCTVRIRHRQEPVECEITNGECEMENADQEYGLRVKLATPLTGVAPGQAAVFTDGDRVLGGAVISAQ